MGHAKIAVSIETELLARVERLRAGTGESRSAVVSRALAQLTAEEAKARKVRQYIEAYRKKPETREEIAAADRLAKRALASLEWADE